MTGFPTPAGQPADELTEFRVPVTVFASVRAVDFTDAVFIAERAIRQAVRLWVEKAPALRGTCPACDRPDRALDPQGRIRFHHDGRTHAPIRCVGTGQRPNRAEERAS